MRDFVYKYNLGHAKPVQSRNVKATLAALTATLSAASCLGQTNKWLNSRSKFNCPHTRSITLSNNDRDDFSNF